MSLRNPTELLVQDNLSSTWPPIYDIDDGVPAIILGENGKMLQALEGPVQVPLMELPKGDEEKFIVKMIIRASGKEAIVVQSLEQAFKLSAKIFGDRDRDLKAAGILSNRKITNIFDGTTPTGYRMVAHEDVPGEMLIFVAEPEFLGYMVKKDGKTGLIIHNPNGIIRFSMPLN